MNGRDLDSSIIAAPQFPGFEKTSFSRPDKRYFYKQNSHNILGRGATAVVETVHWYNPDKGDLELCAAKSFKMAVALEHPDGMPASADVCREVDVLRRLAGVSGVVCFWDVIEGQNGAIHIITEKVAGVCLASRVLHRDSKFCGLTWLEVRLALKHLAQVLAECHKREIVHGDVKVENIMSMKDKSGVMLVDFGTATMFGGSGWEYQGGTYMFTPPEMIRCLRSKPGGNSRRRMPVSGPSADRYAAGLKAFKLMTGPPTDCWAYGVTAFKLLTGRSLFHPPKPAKHATPDVGSGMDNDGRNAIRSLFTPAKPAKHATPNVESGMDNDDQNAFRSHFTAAKPAKHATPDVESGMDNDDRNALCSLFTPAKPAKHESADGGSEMFDADFHALHSIADLHADWGGRRNGTRAPPYFYDKIYNCKLRAMHPGYFGQDGSAVEDVSGSRPVQVTFRQDLQQLSGASEEFHLEGMDFLRALLEPDPAKRLTAEEALRHPFLSDAFDTVARDSMPPEIDAEIILDATIDPKMVAFFQNLE